jgi:hypothetical protein
MKWRSSKWLTSGGDPCWSRLRNRYFNWWTLLSRHCKFTFQTKAENKKETLRNVLSFRLLTVFLLCLPKLNEAWRFTCKCVLMSAHMSFLRFYLSVGSWKVDFEMSIFDGDVNAFNRWELLELFVSLDVACGVSSRVACSELVLDSMIVFVSHCKRFLLFKKRYLNVLVQHLAETQVKRCGYG